MLPSNRVIGWLSPISSIAGGYVYLLYKNQWNTRWTLVWKDIFTHKKGTCYPHMFKDSPLLWLQSKWRFRSKNETVWEFIEIYVINRTLHGHLEIRNFISPSSHVISSIYLINEWMTSKLQYGKKWSVSKFVNLQGVRGVCGGKVK